MKKIIFYLRPYVPRMALGLTTKFAGALMDLALPWILAYIIDEVAPLRSPPQIFLWGGIMVLCAAAALVTNVIANRISAWVSQQTSRALRHDLFSKISYLSCKQMDDYTIASLESRLTTDTYHIHQMVNMMQRMGVRAPILLIGGILVTLTLEPALSLVLILMLPFIGLSVFLISKKGVPLYVSLQKSVDMLVRTVRENVVGIRVIKALSKTEYEKERFSRVNGEVVRREKKAGVMMALTNPLMSFFLNGGLTAVILVGAVRVDAGLTQPGKIIAFLSYFTIILNAMMAVTRMFSVYSKASASARRVAQVLDTPEDLALSAGRTVQTQDHIVFSHVSFSYGGKAEKNIEDVSFRLARGETLGVIGATGCGKSTIMSLLMRLYDADEGEILIGGKRVASMEPAQLHTKFGVVFQDDVLFADSVAANIDFGRGLPRARIERAARCAQAMEFISSLPGGFDHMLAPKGTNLSGGQKQRLLVARALAGNPEILILDDSSSALDYSTDAALRRALRDAFQGVTSLIIAQRISSIRHADRILVLEEGREIAQGTHEELMEGCAVYREISFSQMGDEVVA